MTRILAFICQICPLCICARRWPGSWAAKAVGRLETSCPACRAYRKLFG